ncbi:Cold-shock DNA-binding domain protein [Planctomycetes bacterium CA13]|uniref:Cold-shock DNA-binding domain protein n=1 Tax=Novipirellula herctigrandis TaxID=2527986 RepID=A0A5C5Z787_9BACT|nr:Cold-shock DNA-binding domain protein [Planctomycetes bacterium CA13]
MGRHDDDDDDEKKIPYRIQKRRLGTIRFVNPEGEFGFIDAEDYREDVFFHRSVWQGWDRNSQEQEMPFQENMWVEFELDDDQYDKDKRLRAKLVRLSRRPEHKKLSGRDAPHLVIKHHPNARKKRPTWRG